MPAPKLKRKHFQWTHELAYVVGLITTDGCLSGDRRHIILTSTDKQLLRTFRECLNKRNKISFDPPSKIGRKQAYRIQLGDVVLYEWLEKIGLFPNKSLTIGPIKVPRRFFRDFLRGHLDGDGSIIYYLDRYNTVLNPEYVYDRLFVYFISGSRKHILWLRKSISELKNISGSINLRRPPLVRSKNPNFALKFSTKEAKFLLKWIYYKDNLPKLERKFEIAKPFLKMNN